jgi:hypothetical protein
MSLHKMNYILILVDIFLLRKCSINRSFNSNAPFAVIADGGPVDDVTPLNFRSGTPALRNTIIMPDMLTNYFM